MIPQNSRIVWSPMPGKIVVRLLQETEYASGIAIPARYQAIRCLGEIIAIGGDEEDGDEDYPLRVGDIVAFGSNAGIGLRIGREEVHIFRTSEILTKISWEKE